ncbi:MAG: glycosyltransferase family 1 protein [Burkholderiales bacterium]
MLHRAPVHVDMRWAGLHGIGRFTTEVFRRIPGARALPIAGPKLSPIDPLAGSWALAQQREGCFFSPGFNAPLWSRLPFVFCVHDLTHLRVASESSAVRRAYYASVVRPGIARAWRVLTGSEHARADILDWSGAPPEKVVVVGHGVSDVFNPSGAAASVDGAGYFLHVGSRASHKNVDGLLRAFARSGLHRDFLLVMTGTPDAPTLAVAESLGLAARLRFIGPVDDAALAAWYRGCTALVFPSWREGFGLPVLEAMACGAAVITANTSSLPEVVGQGNGLLIDPADTDALAAAMQQVAEDAALRDRLRRAGPPRAEGFRWDSVALRVRASLPR